MRFFLLMLAALVSLPAASQTTTGTLQGSIADNTGVPLNGATVSIKSTNRATTANADRYFELPIFLQALIP